MRLQLLFPQNQRPGKSRMNQGAIKQEMLEESDNEFTKGEITEWVKKDWPFLSMWYRLKTSPGFKEKDSGWLREDAPQAQPLRPNVELFEEQCPSSEHGSPARNHCSVGRNPGLQDHFLNCRQASILLSRTSLTAAMTRNKSQSNSTNRLTLLANPFSPPGVWK